MIQPTIVKYQILPGFSLILENYQGLIKLPDVENVLVKEFQDPDYNPAFDYLCVLQEANIVLTKEDLKMMTEFLNAVKENVVQHKLVLLTETPGQVASATIYSELLKGMPVELKVFTALDATLHWLNKPLEVTPLIHHFLETWYQIVFC